MESNNDCQTKASSCSLQSTVIIPACLLTSAISRSLSHCIYFFLIMGEAMKIGILGAGMIGANLARKLAKARHQVKLANSRGPDTISQLASEAGATAVTVRDAVKDVAVIVISVPQGAIETLPESLFDDVPRSVVVIDTGNYYPGLRDRTIAEIEAGLPESVWVSQTLNRPVIKAFNSISFTSLVGAGRSSGAADRLALPVAGDDPAAKALVIGLMDEIGFDGLDVGSLADSWRQQPGTPVYCTDLDVARVQKALALADKARAPERRDQFIEKMIPLMRQGGAVDLVGLGRSIYGAP